MNKFLTKYKKMMLHLIRILALLIIFPLASAALCRRRRCGDVDVPYPFGLLEDGPNCYFNLSYAVNCTRNSTHAVPHLRKSTVPISGISLKNHELRVFTYVIHNCYNASGNNTFHLGPWLNASIFPFSNTKNRFTAIGCNTAAAIGTTSNISFGNTFISECASICTNLSKVINGSCSGIGCCQTNVPMNAYDFHMGLAILQNNSDAISVNNCSYAFLAAIDYFKFSTEYLSNFNNHTVPTVVDWSVGDGTCEEAKRNKTSYMCKGNSTCSDVDNGTGYRCTCLHGYQGNPYVSGKKGCQDINECSTNNSCDQNAKCENTMGSFTCLCQKGYDGDGRKNGTGCKPIGGKKFRTIVIALGVSISVPFLLLLCSWLYWSLRQRKITKQREKFFQQNGGLMLQNRLAQHKGSLETTKIFTIEELKKATNDYHESNILGQGGRGTVYKGELNNKEVAIKRAKIVDQTQINEFINEVIILTQINHKNVVKLIGCCLEMEVPLLVYEYITNGTLFDHIHKVGHVHLSWRSHLHIAAEIAGALSYLHTDSVTQVIHRDIKTANILLDNNYTAKVSDFGASRLVPVDQKQVTTLVQGTLGYLDPEYFYEMKLTEKSDVYSFGVVLAELLTGMHALSFSRLEKERNLSAYFVSKYKEGKLLDIIDKRIFDDIYAKEIKEVAMLVVRCLQMDGKERPSMKEVSMELEGLIRATERNPWVESNHDEIENLLIEEVTEYSDTTGSTSMPNDSINKEVAFQIGHGR